MGTAPSFELDFAPRLNLITGNNALGKSFLLDTAWFALTRRWPQEVNSSLSSGGMATPRDRDQNASITATVDGEASPEVSVNLSYRAEDEAWVGEQGPPVKPGLVLYAMADGGFAVWDPARNDWRRKYLDDQERVKAYVFDQKEVWKGLPNPRSEMGMLCNGLVQDWANWQRESNEPFNQLKRVLKVLSVGLDQLLEPGPLLRLRVNDTRDYPTVLGLGGPPVPVVHTSSGVRRILALAYLLVWAWQEHRQACTLLRKQPARQMIFLIDEAEAHLHPSWQRRVVKALMEVVDGLHQNTAVQLLLVTHSPLVMA